MKISHLSRLRNRYTLMISFMFIASIVTSGSIYAHSVGESYIYLKVYENKVTGIFHITLRGLNNALGLQSPEVQITEENLADRIGEIHSYYKAKVHFFDGDKELPIRFTGIDLMRVKVGSYAVMEFVINENAATPEVIDIDYNVLFKKDSNHLALLAIEHFWKAGIYKNTKQISLIFSADNHRQELSFSGHSVFTGFISVVKVGIEHIWKGYDHILFIIALILPAAMFRKKSVWQPVTEFRPALIYVVKIITLFTIAHSLTLSIAALGLFTLPSRLVESVIAISITIAALDIIFPIFRRKIGWVVFVFGLFHGFGFASVLARIGVLGEHMALSLFGFNLGVEIGQVVVICIVFPALYLIRNSAVYSNVLMRYGAVTLILLGIIWTVDRAFLDIHILHLVKNSFIRMIK